jgi:sugar porter (SP) family MFS transporter
MTDDSTTDGNTTDGNTTDGNTTDGNTTDGGTAVETAGGPGKAVIWMAAITALGGLLFGYDTGVVSGALLFLKDDFPHITSLQKELVTSLLLVGAALGAIGAGRVADRIGRRKTILITAAVFVVGVLGAAFSPAFVLLLAARVVIGLAVGSASMVVPMYIGEAAPPKFRGALVSFNQLAITSGILVSYLVDYGLSSSRDWRLMFGLASIPAILLFAGMLTQAESPAWLVSHGREDDARRVLSRLRHAGAVDEELAVMKEGAQRQGVSARELLSPRLRGALTLGVLLAVFQQITGINTVIYYAPTLLNDAGLGSSAALLANVVNGVVNVSMTIVAIWLLDRVGRRTLLISGTCGMAVGLVVIALVFAVGGTHLTGSAAIVAIIALFFYTGSFAIGLGPVFWLLISEIYPVRVRASAMSVATFANWAANFVVTISFLTLLSAITDAGTFFLFGFLTLVAVIYFWRRVPETKGLKLEEISAQIEGRELTPGAVQPQ